VNGAAEIAFRGGKRRIGVPPPTVFLRVDFRRGEDRMRVSIGHGIVAVITGLVMAGLLVLGIFGDKGLYELTQLRGELHRLSDQVERLKE
jgi:hypothetical protein